MTFARRGIVLALSVATLLSGLAFAIPSAVAQDPPNNQGAGQGKANANANAGKKKAPRKRKPRGNGAVGVIVPYPMPPVLIIRHTAETHDEIQAFLNMLRYY